MELKQLNEIMYKILWTNMAANISGIYSENFDSRDIAENLCLFLKCKYGSPYRFTVV